MTASVSSPPSTERMTSACPGRSCSSPKTSRIVRRMRRSSPVAPPKNLALAVSGLIVRRRLHGRLALSVGASLRKYGGVRGARLAPPLLAGKGKRTESSELQRRGRGARTDVRRACPFRKHGGNFAMANRDKVGEGATGKSSGGKGGGGGQAGGGQHSSSGGASKGGGQPGGGQQGGRGGSGKKD